MTLTHDLEEARRLSAGPQAAMPVQPGDAANPESEPHQPKSTTPREVRLEDLLHGDRELLIRHGEDVYHLRITRNGRLLLTK